MPLPPAKFRNRIQLSRQEMCGISQAISRDYSPRFFASRTAHAPKAHFSPQELLDISKQISREYAPNRSSRQSRLVLLAVSPTRLHAYWHISKRRLRRAMKRIGHHPITLRVYTQPESDSEETVANGTSITWVDIAITESDGQQDIYLPEPSPTSTPFQFRAVLGETNDDQSFTPLIYSNTTTPTQSIQPQERYAQPNTITQFIMSIHSASSPGKTASGQGKESKR